MAMDFPPHILSALQIITRSLDNIARNNTESGIYLVESANNNHITGNTFTNNHIGIHFNATSGRNFR